MPVRDKFWLFHFAHISANCAAPPWERGSLSVSLIMTSIFFQKVFDLVAILIAAMVYRASALRGLAVTQMVFGSLMIVFGIASIFSVNNWTSFAGFGIWIGVWVRKN